MSIENELKKNGIEVIYQLDTLKTNFIAKKIATKLCNTFPEHNLDYNKLFIKLSRLNMYVARMPAGMSEATYYYKNSSIYFNSLIDLDNNLDNFAVHECIHAIQENKDKNNNLVKLGLCTFEGFKVIGTALNEAAVQLMTSKVIQNENDIVTYYNITFPTTSPNYYPLQCNLVNQMAYITGEYSLFESALLSNNTFKDNYIAQTSSKVYLAIINNLDKLMTLEEKLIKLNNELNSYDNNRVYILNNKIEALKRNISNTFLKTQNLILCSYFDKAFENINTFEDLENYRRKLYNFKSYIGYTEGYNFFNNYYICKMNALEKRYNYIETYGENLFPITRKAKKSLNLFNKIRNAIYALKKEEY